MIYTYITGYVCIYVLSMLHVSNKYVYTRVYVQIHIHIHMEYTQVYVQIHIHMHYGVYACVCTDTYTHTYGIAYLEGHSSELEFSLNSLKLDEMGKRVDDLEHSINDLMKQVNEPEEQKSKK